MWKKKAILSDIPEIQQVQSFSYLVVINIFEVARATDLSLM